MPTRVTSQPMKPLIMVLLILPAIWLGHASASDKRADGSWKYTNRLAKSNSPYLLLHAHNPVEWYPWGPEALERARLEDKPIFLSVGYSTCHWCHVMERQVFSNPQIAALMNQFFINIKVDREERPDLDRIYMTATQVMTGQGGWPNSVFLTPELEPFFAGTYFPPEESYGRPGFPRVLTTLHDAWLEHPQEVRQTAARIAATIRKLEDTPQDTLIAPDAVTARRALDALKARYDAVNGGFGDAPKFPPAMRLEYLLDTWEADADEQALDMALHTLESMATGGLHDHVGGGFHRYTVDAAWRLPHFEKMLYNQAQLARLSLKAHRLTGDPQWRQLARSVLDFTVKNMGAPEGGFFTAFGAESEGVEGKYYLWTTEELEKILGEGAELFQEVYALEAIPQGEGGVLYQAHSLSTAAADLGLEEEILDRKLSAMRHLLLQTRRQRPRPRVDDKVLTAWNGMMIAALAEAGALAHGTGYLKRAERAADFVLGHLRHPDGGLYRSYRGGQATGSAYLEDYAYLSDGLLRLYEISGNQRWLAAGRQVVDTMLQRLWDDDDGGFYFADPAKDILVRSKNAQDTALPAPNAVAVRCLLDLARWTGEIDYRHKAQEVLTAFGGPMNANPAGYISMLAVVARHNRVGGTVGGATGPAADLVHGHASLANSSISPGQRAEILATFDIAAGWHLNANPSSNEWLLPTVLELDSDIPLDDIKVDYPVGRSTVLDGSNEQVTIYDRRLKLNTDVRIDPDAAPGPGILRLSLRYQACDATRCLPPALWHQELSFEIAPTSP
jgi:uncharacterized protein